MPKRYFRMADDEYQQLCDAAESKGETTSAYIRRVMLKSAQSILRK